MTRDAHAKPIKPPNANVNVNKVVDETLSFNISPP
jgi:hypothetical protein